MYMSKCSFIFTPSLSYTPTCVYPPFPPPPPPPPPPPLPLLPPPPSPPHRRTH